LPKIRGLLKIDNRGSIILGNNINIISSGNFNLIGGDTRTIFNVYKGGELNISDNLAMSNSTIVCVKKVSIEKNVFIGGSVKIYDTDFHPLVYTDRIIGQEKTNKVISKKILIKEGAFIGAHSIIFKGVTIGKNSVIGAGSVVFQSVPDNEIWAGNPAKFVRKNFST